MPHKVTPCLRIVEMCFRVVAWGGGRLLRGALLPAERAERAAQHATRAKRPTRGTLAAACRARLPAG